MPHHLRSFILPLVLPGLLAAADPTEVAMKPTPSNPPAPIGRHHHLVDRAIPAYGMGLHRTAVIDLTAAQLVAEITRFAGAVDARVMSGKLHRSPPGVADKQKSSKDPAPSATRQPLPEETHLMNLVAALTKREVLLRPGGIAAPIPEQQMLDDAFTNLSRAADSLSFGLGDDIYTNLEAQHAVWKQRWTQVRAAKIKALTEGPQKLSQSKAEAAVATMDLSDELPAMDDTPAASAPAPADAAAPAPVEPPPATKPAKPVVEAPKEEPVEAPKPADELPPAEAPAEEMAKPADELPAVEEPAPAEPAPVESAPEAAPVEPAPEAAPVEEKAAEPKAEEAPAEPAPEAKPAEEPAKAPDAALPDL